MKGKPATNAMSPGQYFWMTVSTTVAGGVYLWPQAVVMAIGRQAPYAFLLAGSVAIWLAGRASRWDPPWLLAPAWRWPLTLAAAVETVLLTTATLAIFGHMLQAFYLPRTPYGVLEGIMLGLGGWLATQSVSGLARTVQFWFPLIMLSVAIVAGFSLHALHWVAAVRPSSHLALLPVAGGALISWYLWISGECLPVLSHYLRPQSPPRPWAMAATGLQVGVVGLLYLLVVGALGPEAVAHLTWPLIYVVDNTFLTSFPLSSLGTVTVMSWTVAVLTFVAIHFWCLATCLCPGPLGAHHTIWVMLTMAAVAALMWWNPPFIDPERLLVYLLGPLDLLRLIALRLPAQCWAGRAGRGDRP